MSAHILLAILATLWLAAAGVHADTLPLSQGLIDLRSDQGEELLRDGDALEAYVPLSTSFVTQETQAFCGVASMVTVLNALGVPAPASPEYAPYCTLEHLFVAAREAR
jgi:Phytochelatin synthase